MYAAVIGKNRTGIFCVNVGQTEVTWNRQFYETSLEFPRKAQVIQMQKSTESNFKKLCSKRICLK